MVRKSRLVKKPDPILPSHFRLMPRRGWELRVIGYCVHGAMIDYDDCMAMQTADEIADKMLADDPKYRLGSSRVEIRNQKGEIEAEKKIGG